MSAERATKTVVDSEFPKVAGGSLSNAYAVLTTLAGMVPSVLNFLARALAQESDRLEWPRSRDRG